MEMAKTACVYHPKHLIIMHHKCNIKSVICKDMSYMHYAYKHKLMSLNNKLLWVIFINTHFVCGGGGGGVGVGSLSGPCSRMAS